jgi:competence CoiA-like predicted nuclease
MDICKKCFLPKKIQCLDCEDVLIHRHGEKNKYHYSHKSGTSCGETW